jgi:hypothetical protein
VPAEATVSEAIPIAGPANEPSAIRRATNVATDIPAANVTAGVPTANVTADVSSTSKSRYRGDMSAGVTAAISTTKAALRPEVCSPAETRMTS